jgi:autotransporter strand-loop-strand O-heptosyltransferase
VRFRLEVWAKGESVLCHDYAAAGRDVLIQFPVGTIGDLIGWISYAVKFKELHRCRLTCAIGETLIPLFRDAYPDITFLTHDAVRPERYYATYSVALFFDDHELAHQPCDFRHVGLHRTAGYILGVDPTEAPPRIALADDSRPIPDPYVCVAVQSTTQNKYWNNPHGWREIVSYLKEVGYRVICIDQKPVHGHGLVWTHIPYGVEDETGDRPLQERARWLKHAALFVGLSSGLAWLACADTRGDDQRIYAPHERIFDSLSGHQLSRLQQLLERRALPVRSPRFPVVPPSQRHAASVRVLAAHYRGSREGDAAADPGFWGPLS